MFKPFPLLLSATAILLAYLWYNHTVNIGLPSELLDIATGILSEDHTDEMAATQISRTVIKKILAIETEEASNSCCDNIDLRLITWIYRALERWFGALLEPWPLGILHPS